MSISLRHRLARAVDTSSLRWLLIFPFTAQIAVIVGVVGYVSWKGEEQIIHNFIERLLNRTQSRVEQHLNAYLSVPPQLVQTNADAITLKQIDITNFAGTARYFWKQLQVYDASYISYVLPTGEYAAAGRFLPNGKVTIDRQSPFPRRQGYTYATDKDGKPTKVIDSYTDYNPLAENWYRDAVKQGKLTWTKPYNWDGASQYISISATKPVYDPNKKLICVIAVDILLSKMSDFLRQLQVSPSGRVAIVDRQGLLIGSSSQQEPFNLQRDKAERVSIFASQDKLVVQSAEYWQKKLGSLSAVTQPQSGGFSSSNNHLFTSISPWRDRFGLDWLVIVSIPESDFNQQIANSRRNTVWLMAVALIFAALSTSLLAKWLSDPILQFIQAAGEIAAGNPTHIEVRRPRELKQLAASFNHMARELAATFATLEQNNAELEVRVAQRTASLAQTEAELRIILGAMTELVMVMNAEGRYLKVVSNPHLLAAQPERLLGKTLFDIFPERKAAEFLSCIHQVLTESCPATIEYGLLVDGRETWFSTSISPLPNRQVIIVARDVTALKATSNALFAKNQQLTQAIEQLKTAQADLVQSEKMAVLGQLIAGIAHEINTPLGAIQASIGNINYALEQSLSALPKVVQQLSTGEVDDFLQMLEIARQNPSNLSSREERQLKRQIKQQLAQYGLTDVHTLADYLTRIGLNISLVPWLPLVLHPENCKIFQVASHLVSIDTNGRNVQLAVTQASRIVLALKNYARQDSSSELVNTSVIEGIETVLIVYQNQIKRGVKVVKNYDKANNILAYPDKLTQVWSNLIGNALHAMSYQGRLEIDVYIDSKQSHISGSHSSYLAVKITDSGSGIPPEIQGKIFQPFFTTKPYGEGTGLGLDIVRKIVAEHGGKIVLASCPGKTSFTVLLPLLVEYTEINS